MKKKLLLILMSAMLSIPMISQAAPETEQPAENVSVQKAADQGKWVKSGSRWWFRFEDGSYPADGIMEINGARYGFDKEGYMVTGWYLAANEDGSRSWYYYDSNGAGHTGWLKYRGQWYYINKGYMVNDSIEYVGNEVYGFGKDGVMVTGWNKFPVI
ncbi:hypothetical protein ABXS75_02440 [Roseburia hominis]